MSVASQKLKKTSTECGFTLLEIILALGILATIGVMSINILSGQIAVRRKIAEINTQHHALNMAMQRIYTDLKGAYLSDQKNLASLNLFNRQVPPQFSYLHDNLIFSIQNYQSYLRDSNQSNLAFVRYFVQNDPKDSTKKQLIRDVDTDMKEKIELKDVGISLVLIPDLASFKIQFWNGNTFLDSWDSNASETKNLLPKLVKVHLETYLPDTSLQKKTTTSTTEKRASIKLDTLVYLINSNGQKEATTPQWREYKWQ
jgi:type II secretory pathway pseudopilin PulG